LLSESCVSIPVGRSEFGTVQGVMHAVLVLMYECRVYSEDGGLF
jgi:hypothetical protein